MAWTRSSGALAGVHDQAYASGGKPANSPPLWPSRGCTRCSRETIELVPVALTPDAEWLLTRRRRAEQALISVVATSYLLGVSTRRVERLVEQLEITGLSKSQVSEMAKQLDAQVEAFRNRPLDAGPYTFVCFDALTQKVREGGRTVIVHALIAAGANADGHREILGLDVVSGEDGAGWLAFLRSVQPLHAAGPNRSLWATGTPSLASTSCSRRSGGIGAGRSCRSGSWRARLMSLRDLAGDRDDLGERRFALALTPGLAHVDQWRRVGSHGHRCRP
jgi:hypothetical protein